MPTRNLTPQIVNAAILGFEEQKRHIDTQDCSAAGYAPPVAVPRRSLRRKLQKANDENCQTPIGKG